MPASGSSKRHSKRGVWERKTATLWHVTALSTSGAERDSEDRPQAWQTRVSEIATGRSARADAAALGFVIEAAKATFRGERRGLVPERQTADCLLDVATRHAVQAFVYRGCADSQLPDAVRAAGRFHLSLCAELIRVLRACDAHDIRVVPLKGPVLDAELYGDLALRTSADLDLLVHPQDVVRAKRLLLGPLGYRLESVLHWPAESAIFKCRDSQLSFSDPAERVSVDVHWRLLPGYFPTPFDEADVWHQLRRIDWAGQRILALSPEHLLLFLCAHGAKHSWERLGWICDVARLLQVEPDIDWSSVFAQASRTGTARMVSVGLLLASGLLGVSLPAEAARHIQNNARARKVSEGVILRLRSGPSRSLTALETTQFSMRVLERWSHRVRVVSGIFLVPTEAEYCAVRLPPVLHPLYYLVRPVRLLAKAAHRLWPARQSLVDRPSIERFERTNRPHIIKQPILARPHASDDVSPPRPIEG